MTTLIRSGVSESSCNGKNYKGDSLGMRAKLPDARNRFREVCPQGTLTWRGAASQNQTLDELDLLLTGGRLTPVARRVVQDAYERAPKGEGLRAAQQAITMTAEFNTLGSPLPKPGTRKQEKKVATPATRPYKAVVLMFLEGGADTFNLIVPQQCRLYEEYRKARTNHALGPDELLEISTSGQACRKFGIHGSFRFLKALYDDGQAAFVSNIGNLVEPTSRTTLRQGKVGRCVSLFSHGDQINGAQTLKCQDKGTNSRGVGGRMADELASGPHKFLTTSFSMSGSQSWPQGVATRSEIIGDNVEVFYQRARFNDTISSITAQLHGNVYSDQYAQAFRDSIDETERTKRMLDAVKLKTDFTGGGQLVNVAKLIAARGQRNAERDFFFLRIRGWDMHTNLKTGLSESFQKVDEALSGFVAEMKAQGLWDSVVFATESEFGRTLDSNGLGTDHAWAGNQFIAGGSVKGGRIFNRFPSSLLPGGEQDIGRGRLIPQYPWENMLVPIAEWMGLDDFRQVANAFPNIGNFNSTHILAKTDLFTS
eukprot:CAMPEP_0204527190 /NCGR_PEP_ID=MMETSP0661-20131031/8844_1 /ASSEMBLY_ACC=CAM_ASM_000606 /TAXON_ID=109239 /ORGANISM="Alexandrium margalefi, Strain AMGDE01CS-322" /LENGTH=537 /DNA_ID=CAMNT_0051533075 /DNA_START=99 /DNA_END=1712 /DNA_ORIENTATION=-